MRFNGLFDITGRFPCLNIASALAPQIGAAILDQLRHSPDSDALRQRKVAGLPFVPAFEETVLRHFGLGDGLDVWVTSRRLVFQRDGAMRKAGGYVPAVVTLDHLIWAEELVVSLTWEIELGDIRGLEQQALKAKKHTLRYIVPLTNSRETDITPVALPSGTDSFYCRGDRSSRAEIRAWKHRTGEFREMTGPPRNSPDPGDNAQWFWLLSLPASGPDGDALWLELGSLLAGLNSGEGIDDVPENETRNHVPSAALGNVVKDFDVPGPVGRLLQSAKIVITRRTVSLWSETTADSLSVKSIWHFFPRRGQETRLVMSRLPVTTGERKANLKAVFWLIVLAPFTLFLSLLLIPFALIRTKQAALELPAIALTSASRERQGHSSWLITGAERREQEEGQFNERPRVEIGVPTPPAVLVDECVGRYIVTQANEILAQLAEGKF